MFNRYWLGSMVVLVLVSAGCAIPTSKHPLVDPGEAVSYPELYGAYRFETPEGEDRKLRLLHIGDAGDNYPPGFMQVLFVRFEDSVLTSYNMITFAEKVGDAYIIHLPDEENSDSQSSEPTWWKPWKESWGPWKDGWDRDRADDYLLCRLSFRKGNLYWDMMDSDFLVSEIEADRLTGEVDASDSIPPPKAVCPDCLIGFKCMPYVMRYNHFAH
jgi:hypothetical protein